MREVRAGFPVDRKIEGGASSSFSMGAEFASRPPQAGNDQSLARLMVVDDEPNLIKFMCLALAGQGFETAGFTSPIEAIEALKARDFDVLLTDLKMSQMNGLELLRGALGVDPHLAVIMMTGNATIESSVEAMKLGAFDYVQKPINIKDLVSVLSRGIATRQLKRENVQLRESLGIYELCRDIGSTFDGEMILDQLIDAAIRLCDGTEASILLPDADGLALIVARAKGSRGGEILGKKIPLDRTISGWVMRNREPLILNGEVDDPRFSPLFPRSEISAAISLPLMVRGQSVGVLNISSTKPCRPFSFGQLKGLVILAGAAAPAWKTASMFKEIQSAKEEWEQSFNALEDQVFIMNREGLILRANKFMRDRFEPALENVVGLNYRQVYLGGASVGVASPWMQAVAQGHPFQMETSLPNLEGWFQISSHPLKDPQGQWWGSVAVLRDVTLQRQAEDTLRRFNAELEERVKTRTFDLNSRTQEFELLVRSIPDTAIRIKGDGTVVFFNRSPGEEIPGFDLCTGENCQIEKCSFCRMVSEAVGVGNEARRKEQTGVSELVIPAGVLELRVTPLADGDFLTLVRDISARRKLEVETLNALNKEKELSEMKSRFVSVASHEFRTPLTSMTGSVEILQNFHDTLPAKKRIELLDRIAFGAGRLSSIIDDVMALSLTDTGHFKVKKEPTDLILLFKGIVNEFETIGKSNHQVRLDTSGRTEKISIDGKLIYHIFSNLLTNAIRYSPVGGLIQATLCIEEKQFWFTVRDEGIGIPEKDRARLFESFFRASNVGQISGTGLGLSIVKRYTELLGGKAECLPSTLGACFKVTIPVGQEMAT